MANTSEDFHRLQIFGHRCLRTIGNICLKQKIINEEVRRRTFRSTNKAKSLANIIQQARLRWLGYVLRMDERRLAQVMFATRGPSWKKSRGGQLLTRQSNMKKITKDLAVAGACRLPGWGLRDSPHQWLRTLHDMAQNRRQRKTCFHSLTTK